MSSLVANAGNCTSWGVALAPMTGETQSGDGHCVAPFAEGVLLGVVDGLGHGAEAAQAAKVAVAVLSANPTQDLQQLMQDCHTALKATRGAVLSLASIHYTTSILTWLGVGNVEGLLVRGALLSSPPRASLLLRGGVVGYQLPTLRPEALTLGPYDTLVFATDGVRPGFESAITSDVSPEAIANDILTRYAHGNDDALVLVVRYHNAPP
jgi:negative regulator of sigma-B (phosphoserine phosphatase)